MAKPHSKAGRAIQITSSLPADQLASLCKQSADESPATIRLEEATPGKLVFTVRGRLLDRTQYMTFEVRLAAREGKQVMTSRIVYYKTSQQKLFMLVPMGPKKMLALKSYEQFIEHFGELARRADPHAVVVETQ